MPILLNGNKTKTVELLLLTLYGKFSVRAKFICRKYGCISEGIVNSINDLIFCNREAHVRPAAND